MSRLMCKDYAKTGASFQVAELEQFFDENVKFVFL
jgi:hypothetical protein